MCNIHTYMIRMIRISLPLSYAHRILSIRYSYTSRAFFKSFEDSVPRSREIIRANQYRRVKANRARSKLPSYNYPRRTRKRSSCTRYRIDGAANNNRRSEHACKRYVARDPFGEEKAIAANVISSDGYRRSNFSYLLIDRLLSINDSVLINFPSSIASIALDSEPITIRERTDLKIRSPISSGDDASTREGDFC